LDLFPKPLDVMVAEAARESFLSHPFLLRFALTKCEFEVASRGAHVHKEGTMSWFA
jgi:hypothetical protein